MNSGGIARWDGSNWTGLTSGVSGRVDALAWDAGAGRLFVGGQFSNAGSLVVRNLAAWQGGAWTALGGDPPGEVTSLAWNEVDGRLLVAGGRYEGNILSGYLATLDGSAWATSSARFDHQPATLQWDAEGGDLYVAGFFAAVDGVPARVVRARVSQGRVLYADSFE
jgi:hypothetical protein